MCVEYWWEVLTVRNERAWERICHGVPASTAYCLPCHCGELSRESFNDTALNHGFSSQTTLTAYVIIFLGLPEHLRMTTIHDWEMRRIHGSSSAVCLPSCGRYASLHSTTPDPAQRWGSSRPPILASLPSAQPPFLGGWGRNSGLRGELSLYLSRSYSKSSMSPIGSVTSSETT